MLTQKLNGRAFFILGENTMEKNYRTLNITMLDNELIKALRLEAAKQDKSMSELGREILTKWLEDMRHDNKTNSS